MLSFTRLTAVLLSVLLLASLALSSHPTPQHSLRPHTPATIDSLEDLTNIVMDAGAFRMNINNDGTTGIGGWLSQDPCTGEPAPAARFPADSGAEYLGISALWVGAMIHESGFHYPRVSVANEGWIGDDEFLPIDDVTAISNIDDYDHCLGDIPFDPDGIAPFTVISTFADTATVAPGGGTIGHPIDGPHVPLGLVVTQRVSSFTDPQYDKIALLEFTLENVGDNTLSNVYVGMLTDADVGRIESPGNHYEDDITGFNTTHGYAYFMDGDGRPEGVGSGSDFVSAHVFSVMPLTDESRPNLTHSFNWWWSHGNPDVDFGPSWMDDNSPGNWTSTLGTPLTDHNKYFLMSNRELDYPSYRAADPNWVADHPQEVDDWTHDWKSPDDDALWPDIPQVSDVKALVAVGPLGIDDGNLRYVLAPGDSITVAFACFFGEDVHDPTNPQPGAAEIDPTLYDFSDADNVAVLARNLVEQVDVAPAGWDNAAELTDHQLALSVHPNPTNAAATLHFILASPQRVDVSVVNILGQPVLQYPDTFYPAGSNQVALDLTDMTSGLYIVHLITDSGVASTKAIVIK